MINTIGQKIKALRKNKNITQKQLAKIIGISTSAIGMYETDVRKPSYETLITISHYFDISTDYLLDCTENDLHATIRKIRETKGIGINELSRLSGVNASYISALEKRKKQNPTMATLQKIADALNVKVEELLTPEASKKNNALIKEITKFLYNPLIIQAGGYSINKMTQTEVDQFSKEILFIIKMLGPKYSKKE